MKKNIIGKIIVIISIIMLTIEIGILISYYILINTDFNKYDNEYKLIIYD